MPDYIDLKHTKLDISREERTGFAEVIFCEGKQPKHLQEIYKSAIEADGRAFGTRATAEQYEAVKAVIPKVQYDEMSRILKYCEDEPEGVGLVAVCTAGTSDIGVAEEAAQTAEYFGCRVKRYYDVGVSGIHRLMDNISDIKKAACVIAVAGMEGALASVLGGLVSVPVLAVPTSVGYGASMGGVAAMLAMINTCANGVCTFNIDNGYGAGYMATQINRLAVNDYDPS